MSWELTGNAGTNPATDFLGTTDNEPLIIKTNGAERLRIDSTGNVGIGTAAPGRRLTLAGGPELALRLQDNTVPTGTFWELQASAFLLDHFGIVRYESGVAQGSKSLVIAPDGNVGIGTTEPRTPLHVLGRISTGADFTSAGAITFFPPDGFAWFHIDNGPAGGRPQGRLRISYGGTPGEHEIMSLDQSGNVGIGTSSPAAKLDVQSDSSPGVFAVSQSGVGMWGIAQGNRAGVIALSQSGTGILAAGHTLAGQFNGDVDINGNLFVSGTKSFKIDHPLDAAKK